MYLYVELWDARPEWLALSGVELVGFALNEEETPYRAAYRYLAAWKMPGKE